MLSDLVYSADFFMNRMIDVEPSPRKRKWEEVDEILPRNRIASSKDSMGSEPMGFVDDLSSACIIPDDTYEKFSEIDSFGCTQSTGYMEQARSYISTDDSVHGDRAELTTPVTDMAFMNENYLYDQVNEPGQAIHPYKPYLYNLRTSPLTNGQHITVTNYSTEASSYENFNPLGQQPLNSDISVQSLLWFDQLESREEQYSPQTYPLHDTPYVNTVGHVTNSSECIELERGTNDGAFLDVRINDLYVSCSTINNTLDAERTGIMANNFGIVQDLPDTTTNSIHSGGSSGSKLSVVGGESGGRRDRFNGRLRHTPDGGTGGSTGSLAEKRCKVCGDRAVNHNFGQLTCESCKAFFRRNAHKLLPVLAAVSNSGTSSSNTTTCSFDVTGEMDIRSVDYDHDDDMTSFKITPSPSPSAGICTTELTCTSKTGEHDITPNTRRECPACRLKKCFTVGMRPDLIQVRKKDGSKPRWLDKIPSAAVVHEKHMQTSENTLKPNWGTVNPKSKSHKHLPQPRQTSHDFHEEVCSTDSGSCLSMETSGGGGLATITNSPFEDQSRSTIGKRQKCLNLSMESSGLVNMNPPQRLNDLVVADQPVDCIPPMSLTTSTAATACLPLSTAFNNNSIAPQSTMLIHNQSNSDVTEVGEMTSTNYVPNSKAVREHPSLLACAVNSHNRPIGSVNTLGDFILVANTPQLIVPTNVVTINATASVPTNHAQVDKLILGGTPHSQVGMTHMDLSPSPLIGPKIQYATATYTSFSPIHPVATNNIALETPNSVSVNHSLLTPIWSPTTPHANNGSLLQLRNSLTPEEPFLANCMLATSLQPLGQSIPSTLVLQASASPSINTLGTSSFSLATDLSPILSNNNNPTNNAAHFSATSFVPATQFVMQSSSQLSSCIPSHTLTNPTQATQTAATLLAVPTNHLPTTTSISTSPMSQFPGPPVLARLPTSSAIGFQTNWSAAGLTHSQLSPIKVITSSAICGTDRLIANPTSTTKIHTPTPGLFTPPDLLASSNLICSTTLSNVTTDQLRWPPSLNFVERHENSLHQMDSTLLIPGGSLTYYGTCMNKKDNNVPMQQNIQLCLPFAQINLERVREAWSMMWAEGQWSNPHNIDLNLTDIRSMPALRWSTAITNLWNDILFRRIAVFALSLLAPLCPDWGHHMFPDLSENAVADILSNFTQDGKPMSTADSPSQLLLWEDIVWLAKNRFSDCIPIILINTIRNNSNGSAMMTTESPTNSFWICGKTIRPMNDAICLKPEDISHNPADISHSRNEPTIAHFSFQPGGKMALNLTNLGAVLSQLKVPSNSRSTGPDYPILQYLVDYVTQFGSFLACEPILLSAFLALKLTDPQTLTPSKQTNDSARKQRLSALNSHLQQIFSDAVDEVAMRTDLSNTQSESEAANSRREMLPVFLAWSRQFDTGWHRFEQDCWNQLLLNENSDLLQIAFGLRLLYGESSTSEPDEVLSNLLLTIMNEIQHNQ